jgi:Fe-S cluster assembly protein SufD
LSSALTKPKYKTVIDTYFNQIANKEESLTSLNTAFANEGAISISQKSKVADKPIEIMYLVQKGFDGSTKKLSNCR